MSNAGALKISMETVILTPLVRLNRTNLSIQETLNMVLKSVKNALNIRFMLDQVYLAVTTIVINEADIVLKTPGRWQSRPPNISMNKLKW